jgi:glyoxylate reductase
MKNIFVTRKIDEVGIKMLQDKGYSVDINTNETIPTQDEIINFLTQKNYDAVVTLLTDKIDAKVFDAVPYTKMYANFASGFDNLDIAEAKKRGITISNAPAPITSEAVAEHTLALMLALSARIVEADQYVRDGKYTGWSPTNFIGTDVLGKTLGLVGVLIDILNIFLTCPCDICCLFHKILVPKIQLRTQLALITKMLKNFVSLSQPVFIIYNSFFILNIVRA